MWKGREGCGRDMKGAEGMGWVWKRPKECRINERSVKKKDEDARERRGCGTDVLAVLAYK